MSNRRWILLFALVIALCAAAWLFLPQGGDTVGIWQQGELLYTFNPDAVSEPYEIVLRYEAGETHIHVGGDGVYITSADCKNGDCLRHGPLTEGGTPIVCLPERIVIRWVRDETAPDAVSG